MPDIARHQHLTMNERRSGNQLVRQADGYTLFAILIRQHGPPLRDIQIDRQKPVTIVRDNAFNGRLQNVPSTTVIQFQRAASHFPDRQHTDVQTIINFIVY